MDRGGARCLSWEWLQGELCREARASGKDAWLVQGGPEDMKDSFLAVEGAEGRTDTRRGAEVRPVQGDLGAG